jgi:carbamoyltransferase
LAPSILHEFGPVIHSVEDAIAVFYTSGLDALIIGDLLIEKDE